MEKWELCNPGNPQSFTSRQLKNELYIQRELRKILQKGFEKAQRKYLKKKQCTEEVKAEFNAKGDNNSAGAKGRLARSIYNTERFLDRAEYFRRLYEMVDGVVEELEEIYTMKKDLGHIKGTDVDAKRSVYLRRGKDYRAHVKRPQVAVWNREAIMAIAYDRGYRVEESFISAVAKELDVTFLSAKRLLNSGKFTWGQVLILGLMLEMTPREFAETFMRDYFTEVADGVYRAWGKKEQFVKPLRKRPDPPPEIINVDESGAPIREGDWYSYEGDVIHYTERKFEE